MTTIIDIATKTEYLIQRSLRPGENKIPCPVCGPTRRKPNDPALSLNTKKGAGFCHHCQASFVVKDEDTTFARPSFHNTTALSERVVRWFDNRGITQDTINAMKITEGEEYMPQTGEKANTIQFNYFRDGKLINIKYRDKQKNFKMYKDAEKILYNIDGIKDADTVYICEGEIDALTLIQAGYTSAVSVPAGANTGNNNTSYLDSATDLLEAAKEIVLVTDNDTAGISLKNQLAARLGAEVCSKVDYPDGCKDINEVLMKYGTYKVQDVIESRKPMPVEGIFSADDFTDELNDIYLNGLQPGFTIGDHLDKHLTFEPGRLYVVTGIPGHGKSEFLDFIIERLNALHGMKAAYFSPENHPISLHVSKLIEKITGFQFSVDALSREDYNEAMKRVSDNFFFINPQDNYELDNIIEKARYLVFRKGIKVLVIDPWNKIEHQVPSGMSETNYVSKMLDKVITFARQRNVILFLVAHPRKLNKIDKKYEVPTLYDISGSANFYNKTDFGFTVYRDFQQKMVSVHVQKIKFKHMGSEGVVGYKYQPGSGRYLPHALTDEYTDEPTEDLPF